MMGAEGVQARAALRLTPLLQAPLGALKGVGARAATIPLADLGTLRLSLLEGDLPLPAAILRRSAIVHNGAVMRDFLARHRVSLCPHGKTTMAPQLFERQLADGCWGLSAATPDHVRTYRAFGVPRVLLANQLVGQANFDIIFDALEQDPDFDFFCLIDSHEGLAAAQAALARRPLPRPLQVLIEVGAQGGRTGVRDFEAAVDLARAVAAARPAIALRGVEAFEGIFPDHDPAATEASVRALLQRLVNVAEAAQAEGCFAPGEIILSAGGSAYFDLAAEVLSTARIDPSPRIVLRSGCYLTHDILYYERLHQQLQARAKGAWPGLRSALEVWAPVQSIPEPGRAICALGKRDISHDIHLPQPVLWFRPGLHHDPQPVPETVKVSALNDHHAYLDARDGPIPWRVGDLVGFGVGHPCTTFDKWRMLYLVDDAYRVVEGIRTFF